MPDGTYVIGRSTDCDIHVDNPHVSRQHARVTIRGPRLVIEDLSSRNGVFVGSHKVQGRFEVEGDAEINVAGEIIDLRGEGSPPGDERPGEVTGVHDSDRRRDENATQSAEHDEDWDDEEESTLNTDGFALLSGVVDKMLALGRGEDAERLVAGHLATLLTQATSGVAISAEGCEKAARYATKLGSAMQKGAWIDYVFDLYLAARLVIPVGVVDELYAVTRRAKNLDRRRIRAYIEYLEARSTGLTPPERFALQRIEGLERLAAHI